MKKYNSITEILDTITTDKDGVKRTKKETVSDWLTRIAYQQNTDFKVDFKWRKD